MKWFILYISCIVCFLVSFISCTPEEYNSQVSLGDEVWVDLDFAHQSFDKIDINTRATLDIVQESRILNMYVYLFTADGNRIYSHYFDRNSRCNTEAEVVSADMNCWFANTTDTGKTTGTVRIKAPQTSNAYLYIIANLDEDMMNISSELLNTVTTISELDSFTVSLMQTTVSRNGYFPMVAKLGGVKVDATSIEASTAYLERLDSKITVNISLGNNDELKAFIPERCVIRNLPSGSRVVNTDAADFEAAGYFDSEVTFDEVIKDSEGNMKKSTCSFYMLENRESANRKSSISNYHDRDKRIKNADGSYDESNGLWLNAPENSTYIEIHGELHMEVNTSVTGMQELIGDVIYYIHLGDFASNINNYDILRNTHYTYNVTVEGVNNIRVEVEKDIENQSGATGHIYSASESNFTFDAHYGQRVFGINSEEVDIDQITFYVKTPFGREGTPELLGGGYNLSDLDYGWVKFLINDVDANTGSYSLNNRTYPGDENQMLIEQGREEKLMNVVELINFIKTEKAKYLAYKQNGFTGENPSKFLKDANGNYVLYITAFVNEYFYEEHPTENRSISWKDFVNKPNRLMHILSETKTSKDGASSITSSIFTFRQRSIQTPYNIEDSSLMTGFGCEVEDETREKNLTFYENDNDYKDVDLLNNSADNGLYNTACLWNMFNNGTLKTGSQREKWSTYLDYNVQNEPNNKLNTFLKDNMACMRYAPMSRNRDNNGNGYIDPEEVRWYIASLQQLYTLYVGDLGLISEAQLYPVSLASLPNTQVNGKSQWRNHIVCSNQTTTGPGYYIDKFWPDILWTEEGVSISGYGQEWDKPSPNSIRCIRNLGMENPTQGNIADKLQNVPAPMVVVSNSGNVYRFDLSRMNDKSVRFYTTHELIPSNENAESSRTYYGFETYNDFTSYNSGYQTLREELERGDSPCPEGYRVPNVREAAMMSLYCPGSWWNGNIILSCSYYSHGIYGTNYDYGRVTWYFMDKYITVDSQENNLRCVRDWDPR